MKVLDYIKQLLFEHNCVIVPGFGGILVEYKSAQIDVLKNSFSPPSSNLAFNPILVKDDGLLKSEVARGENISLQKAEELIFNAINEWQNILNKNGEFVLDDIGSFVKGQTSIVFKPSSSINFNPLGYGLPIFTVQPIQIESDMAYPRPLPPQRRVVKREVVEKKEVILDENGNPIIEEKKSSGWKVLLVSLPVLCLLAVGGYFGFKHFEKDSKSIIATNADSTAKVDIDQASIVSPLIEDSNSISETNSSESDGSNSTASTDSKGIDVVKKSVNGGAAKPYAVIVASFETNGGAKKFIGSKGGTIHKQDGRYRVAIDYYATVQEADQARNNFKSQYGEDIWVKRVK